MFKDQAQIIAIAIQKFAEAYNELEELQRSHSNKHLIPIGDQKTGSIGEFYAGLYARSAYPSAKIELTNHSKKAVDIEVKLKGQDPFLIQVSTAPSN